jgi:hypothetical protein
MFVLRRLSIRPAYSSSGGHDRDLFNRFPFKPMRCSLRSPVAFVFSWLGSGIVRGWPCALSTRPASSPRERCSLRPRRGGRKCGCVTARAAPRAQNSRRLRDWSATVDGGCHAGYPGASESCIRRTDAV